MTGTRTVEITRVGLIATFTDLGRVGVEHQGVPRGGAADQMSAVVANLLVGNARTEALIEFIGEFGLRSTTPVVVAVTGADGGVLLDGHPVEAGTPLLVRPGQELVATAGAHGLRRYLAIGGGLEAARFMGSVAPDTRMGFTQRIRGGQHLQVSHRGGWPQPSMLDGVRYQFEIPRRQLDQPVWTLRVVPAAEHDRIPRVRELLESSIYTVRPESDHVGVRLRGPVRHPEDLHVLSHGVPIGAVEIPNAEDELIILGRYRTLTAGYPIVGVVTDVDLGLVAQLAPGQRVTFTWTPRAAAVAATRDLSTQVDALERAVGRVIGRRHLKEET